MASQPVPEPKPVLIVPQQLRELLELRETDTHYTVKTFSGATLLFEKAKVEYPWQLMCGILDDGKDTGEEKRHERDWELAHDERKFGSFGGQL